MNAEQIAEAFALWRKRHLRSAWKPETDGQGSGTTLSHFGGEPSPGLAAWPTCAQCKSPMRLLLQLDLAALPADFEAPVREGLLQLFYCSLDDGSCETWSPFSGTHQIAIVPKQAGGAVSSPVPPLKSVAVTGWSRLDDTPDPEEHKALGLHYDYDFKAGLVHVTCDEPALVFRDLPVDAEVAESISTAASGDKLGGWPLWVQGVEYPSCTECGARMKLFMQIDSHDHLDYMFGDTGCAQLTYCPQHPRIMAFGWACS